jgi:hypothetical protein
MNEIIQMLLRLSQDLEFIKAFIKSLNKSKTELFKENWLDGQDVMQRLHSSKRSLQSLRDTGTLPFSRINGKIYYKLSDIEGLLDSNYSIPVISPSPVPVSRTASKTTTNETK